MYLTSHWLALSEGDTRLVKLGNDGLLWMRESDSAIGLLNKRWFYLREGSTSILRLTEWVYLHEDDYWVLKLPFGGYLASAAGKWRLGRRAATRECIA